MLNPVKIKIEGAPARIVSIKKHPSTDLGERKIKTSQEFLIEKKDYDSLKEGEIYRLIDCLNFIKTGNGFKFHSLDYREFPKGSLNMHWLPDSENNIKIKILMPDGQFSSCLAEESISELKEGDIVQFQRFGFARLDSATETTQEKKTNKAERESYLFVFAHN